MNLTGVTEYLTAKHVDPNLDEGLHEHVWAVTTFYPSEPLRDGRALKAALRMLLDHLPDGDGVMPPDLWSGESIAKAAMILNGVVGVRVTRPEGYEAWAGIWPR